MRRLSQWLIMGGTALLILVADQWSKRLVLEHLELHERVTVVEGIFDITRVHNTGAVAGLLVGQNHLLTVLSVVAIVALVLFRHSFVASHREHLLALGLIAGGIVGNLVDRIQHGYVVDFLDFHWRQFQWYVFNIADAAICVGVISYIVALLVPRKPRVSPPTPAEVASGTT